jgi:hypothetical protein
MSRTSGPDLRLVVVAGALLVAVGLGLMVAAPSPSTFGWFAYQGLPTDDVGSFVVLTPTAGWGVGIVAVGCVLLSGALGYALGRRVRMSSPPPSPAGDTRDQDRSDV